MAKRRQVRKRHGWLALVILTSWAAGLVAPWTCQASGSQDLKITVGPNIQVSKVRANAPHFEVQIAADPENPRHMLACSMASLSVPHAFPTSVVAYRSFDGGASWEDAGRISETGGVQVADPSCAYGKAGIAYLLANEYDGSPPSRTLILKSENSRDPMSKFAELPWMDRPYLTIDNTRNQSGGTIYVNGTGSIRSADRDESGIYDLDLWRSIDSSATFLGPIKLAATDADHIIEAMGNGVVLSDGTFIAITGEIQNLSLYDQKKPYRPIGRLITVSSTDGGKSFMPPTTVSDWYPDRGRWATCSLIPSMAVDRSSGPFKNRLYAVWSDLRFGRMAVVMSHSSDGGKTWSTAVDVSQDEPRASSAGGMDDCMPNVAVNSLGVVGIMWYDRRDVTQEGYWPRFNASLDGGETFLPSVKVSEQPSSVSQDHLLLNGTPRAVNDGWFVGLGVHGRQFAGGDTAGLTATPDGVFHPLWVDNRTGVLQVWTTTVTVSGRAAPNVEPGFFNVSNAIKLHLGTAAYDRVKHKILVEASLENVSKEALGGKIMLRALSLSSRIGKIAAINSDNNLEGTGCLWNFTPQLNNGMLKPGERSATRILEFRIDESSEEPANYESWFNILQLHTRVIATTIRTKR